MNEPCAEQKSRKVAYPVANLLRILHVHTYIVIFQDSQLELEMPKSIPSHTCTLLYTCSQFTE